MTNILLVEDDEVDVMNVQRAFNKNNITNPLYVASNGLEALVMLPTNGNTQTILRERGVILLEFNMPKINAIHFW